MVRVTKEYWVVKVHNTMPNIDYGRFGYEFPRQSVKYFLVVNHMLGIFKSFAESTKGISLEILSLMISDSAIFENIAEIFPYTPGRVSELLGKSIIKEVPVNREETSVEVPILPITNDKQKIDDKNEGMITGEEDSLNKIKEDIQESQQSVETLESQLAEMTVEELLQKYKGVIKLHKKDKAHIISKILEYENKNK